MTKITWYEKSKNWSIHQWNNNFMNKRRSGEIVNDATILWTNTDLENTSMTRISYEQTQIWITCQWHGYLMNKHRFGGLVIDAVTFWTNTDLENLSMIIMAILCTNKRFGELVNDTAISRTYFKILDYSSFTQKSYENIEISSNRQCHNYLIN